MTGKASCVAIARDLNSPGVSGPAYLQYNYAKGTITMPPLTKFARLSDLGTQTRRACGFTSRGRILLTGEK
jgi:hypothetical protein